ncbi:MAG: GyrI-like domain-containing protein [Fidelibacterota bacterium]
MPKLDLRKELKHLYQPSAKEVGLVNVPPMSFLMIDGKGDPNQSGSFQQATEVLYGVSFTVKFDLKKRGIGPEYAVLPLEGLWWTEGGRDFDMEDNANWLWTLMIMQPEHISSDHVAQAVEIYRTKKGGAGLEKIRFEQYEEGLSAQIMHVGPYSEEGPTIERIHEFVLENGYTLYKKHHEIYLSDPRRAKPEKLRTVLRHPVTQD